MGIFFNYNATLFEEGQAVISAGNRALNYGDGIFETMRVENDSIYLGNFHFERLFAGLSKLNFIIPAHFREDYLEEQVISLCKKNRTNPSRARLMVFPSGQGIKVDDRKPVFIIESFATGKLHGDSGDGLLTGLYSATTKSCDSFSHLKTNNFLPYAMAALHAERSGIDDCFLLNQHGRICDSTIANVFLVKNGLISTPSLEEGCIAGVFRKYLIHLPGLNIIEKPISLEELEKADEVFLTNSVRGIRSVKQFGDIHYNNSKTREILRRLEESNA